MGKCVPVSYHAGWILVNTVTSIRVPNKKLKNFLITWLSYFRKTCTMQWLCYNSRQTYTWALYSMKVQGRRNNTCIYIHIQTHTHTHTHTHIYIYIYITSSILHCLNRSKERVRVRGSAQHFTTSWEVVKPRTKLQAGGPPFVGCPQLRIQYTQHLEAVSSTPQHEDAPGVVTGTQ